MLAGHKWCLWTCVVFKRDGGIWFLSVWPTNKWELFLSHLYFFCLQKDWRRWDDLHRRYYFSTGGYFTSFCISVQLGIVQLCFIIIIITPTYCYLMAFRLSCCVCQIFSRMANLEVVHKLLLKPMPTIKVYALWIKVILLKSWQFWIGVWHWG